MPVRILRADAVAACTSSIQGCFETVRVCTKSSWSEKVMKHITVPGHREAVGKHRLGVYHEPGKSLWKLGLAERIRQPQREVLCLPIVLTQDAPANAHRAKQKEKASHLSGSTTVQRRRWKSD